MMSLKLYRLLHNPGWRTECCGVLTQGRCTDCPVTFPTRPSVHADAQHYSDSMAAILFWIFALGVALCSALVLGGIAVQWVVG